MLFWRRKGKDTKKAERQGVAPQVEVPDCGLRIWDCGLEVSERARLRIADCGLRIVTRVTLTSLS